MRQRPRHSCIVCKIQRCAAMQDEETIDHDRFMQTLSSLVIPFLHRLAETYHGEDVFHQNEPGEIGLIGR